MQRRVKYLERFIASGLAFAGGYKKDQHMCMHAGLNDDHAGQDYQ